MNKYFTIAELSASQYATRNSIDNTPSPAVKLALIDLIDNVLVPIRLNFEKPVVVSSGYRCPKLNKAIGGAKNSDHIYGFAADFTVHGWKNSDVCDWIEDNLKFTQCILEFGNSGWIHVSYNPANLKCQTLRAVKVSGKTTYLNGFR